MVGGAGGRCLWSGLSGLWSGHRNTVLLTPVPGDQLPGLVLGQRGRDGQRSRHGISFLPESFVFQIFFLM